MANVTLPDRSNRIVVSDSKLQEFLAQGYISDEQSIVEQDALAEQNRQEWLANPETLQERFDMLRMACESKLAQTDFAINIDFPITEESKSALLAYRKAIRELNHQNGAPWDGGGELTPWPAMPTITKTSN